MMKMFGGVMIVAVSLWLGMKGMNWYRRRCRVLSELIHAISRMEAELSGRETETAELLKLLGRGESETARLFRACSNDLEALEERPFREIWLDELNESRLPLKGEERETAERLGHVLGRYDSGLQTRLLEGLRCELEELLSAAREESAREGKCALTVSGCVGLLLVLLLI